MRRSLGANESAISRVKREFVKYSILTAPTSTFVLISHFASSLFLAQRSLAHQPQQNPKRKVILFLDIQFLTNNNPLSQLQHLFPSTPSASSRFLILGTPYLNHSVTTRLASSHFISELFQQGKESKSVDCG
ncbi:hypothetical protein B5807_04912 [Epicoccum nigrum]|uniref:Uncharacterized protein n=1 Tax=Epicoccum nigrum TaxID=105696 RepID=A0A1Y2M2C8_EPING|nr:hypothetical protein B5807_04912 [Epicoccum nigrum]